MQKCSLTTTPRHGFSVICAVHLLIYMYVRPFPGYAHVQARSSHSVCIVELCHVQVSSAKIFDSFCSFLFQGIPGLNYTTCIQAPLGLHSTIIPKKIPFPSRKGCCPHDPTGGCTRIPKCIRGLREDLTDCPGHTPACFCVQCPLGQQQCTATWRYIAHSARKGTEVYAINEIPTSYSFSRTAGSYGADTRLSCPHNFAVRAGISR